jgi:hypothetical protein
MARRRLGQVFAVVRLDGDGATESQVTVKEIVPTEEEAVAEVDRLNALRTDDLGRYFWQATRYMATDEGSSE